jgi:hypothetical protein
MWNELEGFIGSCALLSAATVHHTRTLLGILQGIYSKDKQILERLLTD